MRRRICAGKSPPTARTVIFMIYTPPSRPITTCIFKTHPLLPSATTSVHLFLLSTSNQACGFIAYEFHEMFLLVPIYKNHESPLFGDVRGVVVFEVEGFLASVLFCSVLFFSCSRYERPLIVFGFGLPEEPPFCSLGHRFCFLQTLLLTPGKERRRDEARRFTAGS